MGIAAGFGSGGAAAAAAAAGRKMLKDDGSTRTLWAADTVEDVKAVLITIV